MRAWERGKITHTHINTQAHAHTQTHFSSGSSSFPLSWRVYFYSFRLDEAIFKASSMIPENKTLNTNNNNNTKYQQQQVKE